MRAFAIAACLLSATTAAHGQDYPAGSHLFHGTTDNDSLLVQCGPPSNGSIRCKFAQTMVRRLAKSKDFEAELPKSIDQLLAEKDTGSCANIAEFGKALREGTIPPGITDIEKYQTAMDKMELEQKQDMLDIFDKLAGFCAKPDRTTAEAMLRRMHDKESRTCRVSTNIYEQSFTEADTGHAWISNEGPAGDCGVIYISKFERSKDEFKMWVYHTQKVVTNKDAGIAGLMSCADLDERKFFYDWRSDEKFLRCDYIEFGP